MHWVKEQLKTISLFSQLSDDDGCYVIDVDALQKKR